MLSTQIGAFVFFYFINYGEEKGYQSFNVEAWILSLVS